MPYAKLRNKKIRFPYNKYGKKSYKLYKKTKRGRYIPDKYYNDKQLLKGTETELEHTSNIKTAKKIAKDHLAEHPKYYTYLKKMEKRMKKRRKRSY